MLMKKHQVLFYKLDIIIIYLVRIILHWADVHEKRLALFYE